MWHTLNCLSEFEPVRIKQKLHKPFGMFILFYKILLYGQQMFSWSLFSLSSSLNKRLADTWSRPSMTFVDGIGGVSFPCIILLRALMLAIVQILKCAVAWLAWSLLPSPFIFEVKMEKRFLHLVMNLASMFTNSHAKTSWWTHKCDFSGARCSLSAFNRLTSRACAEDNHPVFGFSVR